MRILFVLREGIVEFHIYARSEKDAIAKANKISPRNWCVFRILQQDDEQNKIGVFEDLIDAVRNLDFRHNS